MKINLNSGSSLSLINTTRYISDRCETWSLGGQSAGQEDWVWQPPALGLKLGKDNGPDAMQHELPLPKRNNSVITTTYKSRRK